MTTDNEIQEQYRKKMQTLARIIDDNLNPDGKKENGFFIAMYPHGAEGRFNYISNSNRADVIVLLKEMLVRFQGQPEMKGTA